MDARSKAKSCVDQLLRDADRGGSHYAPCFRDCLGDNREHVERVIAKAITAAVAEATSTAGW